MSLRAIANVYRDIQKIRVALQNRTWAAENGRTESMPRAFAQMCEQLKKMEGQVVKAAEDELRHHPLWPWLKRVKGLGPTLAMQLIGYIGEIERFPTVSKLWRYAGLGVVDGKAERPRAGEKLHYKPQFKGLMYNIGVSFLKSNSPYRRIYDVAKVEYELRLGWSKKRAHLAALRKMEKIFLAHVWEVWRRQLGLPVRDPYVFEYLGHSTKYLPEEFVL